MTLYKYLHLVELRDTRLGKKKPWEINASPIVVAVVVDVVIPDRLGQKRQ